MSRGSALAKKRPLLHHGKEAMSNSSDSAGKIGGDCPVCAGPIAPGERWGVASTCGNPQHVGRYHLGCWESREGEVSSACALCDGAPTGFVPVFVDMGVQEGSSGVRTRTRRNEEETTIRRRRTATTVASNRRDVDKSKSEIILGYQFGADGLGTRIGACLEKMETAVELFLTRILVGEINEIVFGAFAIGFLLGVIIIRADDAIYPGCTEAITKRLPNTIRLVWLCIVIPLLPDAIRMLGDIAGVKEPMKTSIVIIPTCIVAASLWFVIGEMVVISFLMDIAGEHFE